MVPDWRVVGAFAVVLEFARYYGYYPGAEAQGQEAAALTGQNLAVFKTKFR
jgi:hypothetical protein